jgi:hypothetical protein
MKEHPIAGQKFGALIALHRVPWKGPHVKWAFRCDCGVIAEMFKSNVVRGAIQTCVACGHKKQNQAITKHGQCYTKEYHRYAQAKTRCRNPKCKRYDEYGGRGIEFRFESFAQFFAELGVCPPDKTLDRIDNNGHYEIGNVRWATAEQQYASRRPWNWRQWRTHQDKLLAAVGK